MTFSLPQESKEEDALFLPCLPSADCVHLGMSFSDLLEGRSWSPKLEQLPKKGHEQGSGKWQYLLPSLKDVRVVRVKKGWKNHR